MSDDNSSSGDYRMPFGEFVGKSLREIEHLPGGQEVLSLYANHIIGDGVSPTADAIREFMKDRGYCNENN